MCAGAWFVHFAALPSVTGTPAAVVINTCVTKLFEEVLRETDTRGALDSEVTHVK